MSSNKVYITGMSALTPSGNNLDDTWSNILSGQSSIKKISNWDINNFPVNIGGEIINYNEAKMLPDKKLKKAISKQDNFGINAAMQAMEQSGLNSFMQKLTNENPKALINFADRSGIYVGSPGNKYFQQHDFIPLIAKTNGNMQEFAKHLFDEVHPMWLLRSLPNNVLAYVGITYGFKGANHNITNHAVSGTQAIIEAYHAIKSKQIDRACIVAYDLGIEPQALYYYEKLGVLSTKNLQPFDKNHDGTVLAEGASAIILENSQSAQERGAHCYAELIGGNTNTECSGLFSIEEDGNNLKKLLNNTLNQYQLSEKDINLIIAHGNGNPKSDISESIAITDTFSSNPPTTAFKWAMGHTLCASGILDTALAVTALQNKCIPGIANLQNISPDCRGININQKTRTLETNNAIAMLINRGFASMNACLLIKLIN